jgi:hypothetical protein
VVPNNGTLSRTLMRPEECNTSGSGTHRTNS